MVRRLLIAWEFGDNYGHASQIATLLPLLDSRAEVLIAARDVQTIRRFAPRTRATLIPVPTTHMECTPSLPPSQSYADDLARLGWGQTETLSGMVSNWTRLLTAFRPDLVIAKAAPTALLSARAMGITTCAIGFGYDLPPLTSPLPAFRHWADTPQLRSERSHRERTYLETVNAALASAGLSSLACLADAFAADRSCLLSPSAIDAYGDRGRWGVLSPEPVGPLLVVDQGEEVQWSDRTDRTALAYLRLSDETPASTIRALEHLAALSDLVVSAPGIPPDLARELRRAGARVADGPVRLDALLPRCRLGISHGSNNMAAAFTLFRTPQICLPRHIEQVMVTKAVTDAGQGVGFRPHADATAITRACDHFLTDPRYEALKSRANPDRVAADLAAIPARLASKLLAMT